jgi:hypothetical protein
MKETSMTDTTRRHAGPTQHQEALMVWIAVPFVVYVLMPRLQRFWGPTDRGVTT